MTIFEITRIVYCIILYVHMLGNLNLFQNSVFYFFKKTYNIISLFSIITHEHLISIVFLNV